MNLQHLLKSVFDLDLPISGNGKTLEDPVILGIEIDRYYIDLEYSILKCLFIWKGVKWNTVCQNLHFIGEKKIDELIIEIQDAPLEKHIERFYFDVTKPFDEFEKQMEDYFGAKEKLLNDPNILLQFKIIRK